MARTTLFFLGSSLALLSAIYSSQQPIVAGWSMWTLSQFDGAILLLMLPFVVAVAASVASIAVGWKLHIDKQTSGMVAVLLAGAILPLLGALAGHAAICSVVCKPM